MNKPARDVQLHVPWKDMKRMVNYFSHVALMLQAVRAVKAGSHWARFLLFHGPLHASTCSTGVWSNRTTSDSSRMHQKPASPADWGRRLSAWRPVLPTHRLCCGFLIVFTPISEFSSFLVTFWETLSPIFAADQRRYILACSASGLSLQMLRKWTRCSTNHKPLSLYFTQSQSTSCF